MEGDFTRKETAAWHGAGERASIVVRQDNLKMEGDFIKRQEQTWQAGERAQVQLLNCQKLWYPNKFLPLAVLQTLGTFIEC